MSPRLLTRVSVFTSRELIGEYTYEAAQHYIARYNFGHDEHSGFMRLRHEIAKTERSECDDTALKGSEKAERREHDLEMCGVKKTVNEGE